MKAKCRNLSHNCYEAESRGNTYKIAQEAHTHNSYAPRNNHTHRLHVRTRVCILPEPLKLEVLQGLSIIRVRCATDTTAAVTLYACPALLAWTTPSLVGRFRGLGTHNVLQRVQYLQQLIITIERLYVCHYPVLDIDCMVKCHLCLVILTWHTQECIVILIKRPVIDRW